MVFIPFGDRFIPFRNVFVPFVGWFIPFHAAVIPFHPINPKIKDPEKSLGLTFFLFNLSISVNFGAGF